MNPSLRLQNLSAPLTRLNHVSLDPKRSLDDLRSVVWEGKRINPEEALQLYFLPLEELGILADRRRQLAKVEAYGGRGNEIVTYIVDRNINYTNVCNVYCKFCAFYRVERDADAYVIAHDEISLGRLPVRNHHVDIALRKTRFPESRRHRINCGRHIADGIDGKR